MEVQTQDVLFIVLAFCALWFTVFLCFLMYQAAGLLKRVHGLVDEMKERIISLEDAIMSMKRKFEGNLNMVSTIAEGVKNIIAALRSRGEDVDD